VLKGGHREGDVVTDLLFDGEQFHTYSGPRVQTSSTHGTGCTFASAIAAQLALGSALPQAVRLARGYVQGALEHARPLGHGHGPVNHFWRWEER
jgi:hydroxymethylpyrimidine/phosphomethylpyrimidine kinase